MKKVICQKKIINKIKNDPQMMAASLLRPPIFNLIKKDYPQLNKNCYIHSDVVAYYRDINLQNLIKESHKNYNKLDKKVIESILNKQIIADNLGEDIDEHLTLGQRIADKVAEFGGSWTFIISFSIFLMIWVATNVWFLASHPFDPYPFILLNLFLSMLAAFQAPVIMMSQNRQEEKDRERDINDYKTNLKAELEIRLLNDKVDILTSQNQRIIELLELDTDYLEDLKDKNKL